MQIFYLDKNPILATQTLCNKHLIKAILESAQLLCTAHHIHPLGDLPDFLYKQTHSNHPCAIWTRQNQSNYKWLSIHALELCYEYTYRYNKIHKSQPIIEWCCRNIPNIPTGHFTQPPQAMPPEYRNEDSVKAYRRYYLEHKRFVMDMKWTKREPPIWWNV